jgi:hypothetical protein
MFCITDKQWGENPSLGGTFKNHFKEWLRTQNDQIIFLGPKLKPQLLSLKIKDKENKVSLQMNDLQFAHISFEI